MISAQISRPCARTSGDVLPQVASGGACAAWKRSLDIGLLLCVSPVLAPLMLFIALVIKVVSRGPVLFSQERIGLNGVPFTCLKFRTMVQGADTGSHQQHLASLINSSVPMTKLDDGGDKRIIPFGGLLRASGLDELPQVINVLRGDMSLVGPRPCIRYEYERYPVEDRKRFEVLPGITGLWQVSGKNETTFRQMVELDASYASNLSFGRDVSIICRTFPVVLGQVWRVIKRRSKARAGNFVNSVRKSECVGR